MKNLIYFAFILLPISLLAQPQIQGDLSSPPFAFSKAVLDESKMNVFYDTKIVSDPKKNTKFKQTITMLQLGDRYAKFMDFHNLAYDSLLVEQSSQALINTNDINALFSLRYKINFKITTLIDFSENQYVMQERVLSNAYQYTQPMPSAMAWKLKKDEKAIGDYKVKKAEIKQFGRDWTAWYTEEIPIAEGPYKFRGLPGLILELYDSKNHYHFIFKGLDQNPVPIYIENTAKIQLTTREAFRKAEKSYHDSPDLYQTGKIYDANKNEINLAPKALPYNPIELE